MSNCWGDKFKVSIFGESHGGALGIVIDGIPPGFKLDLEEIEFEMKRRAPGRDEFSTPRGEEDLFEILSGFFAGRCTGTPLCAIIRNKDTRSKDYDKHLMRPGHADFSGFVKYNGANDYRGGGHFSGRLTAPLVFAGTIAKQILRTFDIFIGAHIQKIGSSQDASYDKVNLDRETFDILRNKRYSVINDEAWLEMSKEIFAAKERLDSVGGIIECGVVGLKAGIGEPFFGSIESKISSMMFSVPAVKGIEFGAGFGFADMSGSSANDEFYIDGDEVKCFSNNNGGINGGISNGMPVVFSVVIKPTSSIGARQRTVNIELGQNAEIQIHGRHDPCIVPRAVPVIEAGCAIAVLSLIL